MKKSSRVRKDLEFGILVESYVDSRSQNVCSFFRFCNSSRHVNEDACGILLYVYVQVQVQSVGGWVQVREGAGAIALGADATDMKLNPQLITAIRYRYF